jgi:Uma2 family endonuclease
MDDTRVLPARHRLDVEEYHRMAEAGVFGEDDRIELIDGDLIDMALIGQGHAGTVSRLTQALVLACAGRAIVSPQNPVWLDQASEPQPDLALLRYRADFYFADAPPGPADVLLLIEVADTSLRFDQTVKAPLYARAGIPELWIVDLSRRVVHVHRTPAGDSYRDVAAVSSGDRLVLAAMPEIAVTLESLFG